MYDIYTEVASFMNWINETILSMGGMQSCGLTLENRPTEGKVDSLYVVDVVNKTIKDGGVASQQS